jgi:hypothetical protein
MSAQNEAQKYESNRDNALGLASRHHGSKITPYQPCFMGSKP